MMHECMSIKSEILMYTVHGPELGSTDLALIFLGGTQNLVSGSDHGGVETMSDEGEVEAEPGNQ